MKKWLVSFVLTGAALSVTASATAATANDERLPAQQVIAAIQAAVAVHPGDIKEVEVDEKRGRLLVEVTIIGPDGAKKEVRIDPATNKVAQ